MTDIMELENLRNKIREVMAYARVLVQEYGHLKKFAKHIAAFAIKQLQQLPTDVKLIDFISTNPIGKELGYNHRPDPSIFSKVRERLDPKILAEMISAILTTRYKNTVVKRIVQDSTDVDAYSKKDSDARWGIRTVPKNRQQKEKEHKEFFFGYKLHIISDADKEMPLSISIVTANKNDKTLFPELYGSTKANYRLKLGTKFLADAQYSSFKIRNGLRYDGHVPVIPISGNKYMKTEQPKDPDYKKRWSVEHIFSRLKEMFNMRKNRFIGIKKVKMHVYSCILAYLVEFLM